MNEIEQRVRLAKGPRRILSREREAELTRRQREILDDLGAVFDDGFVHLTMADLAKRMNCSLRTLYGLAPSRDELVLVVVDRNLWRVGRAAMAAIDSSQPPLEVIRAYLAAANVAVATMTEAFAHDCDSVTATRELNQSHLDYLIAITHGMLDLAVERGEIDVVDTAAVARVLAAVGTEFARADVLPTLKTSPKKAADEVVGLILAGLSQ